MSKRPAEKATGAASKKAEAGAAETESIGALGIFREWTDALIIAFVLAMFVRIFIVELFKIPTGSMTPTLVGDPVAEVDWNGDGLEDLIVQGNRQTLVFINKGGRFEIDPEARVLASTLSSWQHQGLFKNRYDRILVNKFAYWRKLPVRGDVVVFKVPLVIWDPDKPIYIKRMVGLPGEEISFEGRLLVNGEPASEAEFFEYQEYINDVDLGLRYDRQPYAEYESLGFGAQRITRVRVPEDGVYVLGDNTRSSLDSRYWGVVPSANLKGKAFMRYWPLSKIQRLRHFSGGQSG